MQTMEGVFSLAVFFSVCAAVLLAAEPQRVDYALYRIQLADDAWRVLYLRGTFSGLDRSALGSVEGELNALGETTGLCFFIDGVQMTNCRDGQEHEEHVTLPRTVIYDGKPRKFAFSIGK